MAKKSIAKKLGFAGLVKVWKGMKDLLQAQIDDRVLASGLNTVWVAVNRVLNRNATQTFVTVHISAYRYYDANGKDVAAYGALKKIVEQAGGTIRPDTVEERYKSKDWISFRAIITNLPMINNAFIHSEYMAAKSRVRNEGK